MRIRIELVQYKQKVLLLRLAVLDDVTHHQIVLLLIFPLIPKAKGRLETL